MKTGFMDRKSGKNMKKLSVQKVLSKNKILKIEEF